MFIKVNVSEVGKDLRLAHQEPNQSPTAPFDLVAFGCHNPLETDLLNTKYVLLMCGYYTFSQGKDPIVSLSLGSSDNLKQDKVSLGSRVLGGFIRILTSIWAS